MSVSQSPIHKIMPVKRAIKECGGAMADLAERLDVSQQLVSMWIRLGRNKRPLSIIQAEMAVKIEAATNGKVRRQDIRPDLYRGMIDDKEYKQANKLAAR